MQLKRSILMQLKRSRWRSTLLYCFVYIEDKRSYIYNHTNYDNDLNANCHMVHQLLIIDAEHASN
jgi:hypothetical protein